MKLNTAMLCMDCDQISDISTHCPFCLSKIVAPLARWIPPLNSVGENRVKREKMFSETEVEQFLTGGDLRSLISSGGCNETSCIEK